jgi:hypothetical protein
MLNYQRVKNQSLDLWQNFNITIVKPPPDGAVQAADQPLAAPSLEIPNLVGRNEQIPHPFPFSMRWFSTTNVYIHRPSEHIHFWIIFAYLLIEKWRVSHLQLEGDEGDLPGFQPKWGSTSKGVFWFSFPAEKTCFLSPKSHLFLPNYIFSWTLNFYIFVKIYSISISILHSAPASGTNTTTHTCQKRFWQRPAPAPGRSSTGSQGRRENSAGGGWKGWKDATAWDIQWRNGL